ncbi:MAG: hypothetical protein N2Z76_09810 [Treponemataceae bacterium]|nr:hypothetical protein [Treponemataceae bacterium]
MSIKNTMFFIAFNIINYNCFSRNIQESIPCSVYKRIQKKFIIYYEAPCRGRGKAFPLGRAPVPAHPLLRGHQIHSGAPFSLFFTRFAAAPGPPQEYIVKDLQK